LGEKFTVVAQLLHLTRARVSQLHRRALRRCATLLRERGYDVSLNGANQ
jgi:DNA-directed RNA polymerase specialized sigma subunit